MLLQCISDYQLMLLTNDMLPPGPLSVQVQFFTKLQAVFKGWSTQDLQYLHTHISNSPPHLETQQLLEAQPDLKTNWEIIRLLVELLKFPIGESLLFREWIVKLPPSHLELLSKLVKLSFDVLIQLKQQIQLPTGAADVTENARKRPRAEIESGGPPITLSDSFTNLGVLEPLSITDQSLMAQPDMLDDESLQMQLDEKPRTGLEGLVVLLLLHA